VNQAGDKHKRGKEMRGITFVISHSGGRSSRKQPTGEKRKIEKRRNPKDGHGVKINKICSIWDQEAWR